MPEISIEEAEALRAQGWPQQANPEAMRNAWNKAKNLDEAKKAVEAELQANRVRGMMRVQQLIQQGVDPSAATYSNLNLLLPPGSKESVGALDKLRPPPLPRATNLAFPGGGSVKGVLMGDKFQFVPDHSLNERRAQQDADTKGFIDAVNAGDDTMTAYQKFPMATGPFVNALTRGQETIEWTPEGGKITRTSGVNKAGKSGTDLTVGAKTKMQEDLASYESPIATIGHIEKNMRSTDFGLAGKAGEFMDRYVAQLKPEAADPRRETVRNSLRLLRADLYRTLRSDSNINKDEQKQIVDMLPSDAINESLPRAAQMLIDVRQRLINNARDKSQRLGVLPPRWSMTAKEISKAMKNGQKAIALGINPDSQEFKSKFLTEPEAIDALNKYYPEWPQWLQQQQQLPPQQ